MQRNIAALVLVVLCGCLGACDGGPQAMRDIICVTVPAPPSMIYPENGASGVPDGNFTLVISQGITPSLAIGSSVVIKNLPPAPVPSPLPSPSATLPPTGGFGYAVPTLSLATTYQVMVPRPPSGCYDLNSPPPSQLGSIGSFTTK